MSNESTGTSRENRTPPEISLRSEAVIDDHAMPIEFPGVAYTALFWAFLRGVGTVLEICPPPGRFDRWRMKDSIPKNEWALLFDELRHSSHLEEPRSEVKS